MKPSKTARFYGFSSATDHIKEFQITKNDLLKAKPVLQKNPVSPIAEKVALIRMFCERKMATLPQPAMIFYKSLLENQHSFNLEIIGNPRSIADAILIETAYVIAKEEHEDLALSIELNTLGDKESIGKLHRELGAFYRKNWSKVPKDLRLLYKKDLFESFRAIHPAALELRMEGPDPIRCLSEQSRLHFKEVLEYIENLNIPYAINHSLLGDPSYGSETVFEIVSHSKTGERKRLAHGQRYNCVARKFLNKKDIAAIGACLYLKKESMDCETKKKEAKPKFFFIQLGFEAKLQSLQLLETLRKANMGVYQSLTKDRMTSQLALAEKMEIPYVIIMGKKEAMESSVLVRNMESRCQDTVKLGDLVEYIKKIK
jgi:histidyl-tRNA synthetase